MRKILPFLAVTLLMWLPFTSCAPSDGFQAGRPITKDELASISAELFNTAREPEPPTADPEASAEAGDGTREDQNSNINQTVYWALDGKSYHADRRCHRLDGEFSVKESTRRTAEASGLRPCKDCVND